MVMLCEFCSVTRRLFSFLLRTRKKAPLGPRALRHTEMASSQNAGVMSLTVQRMIVRWMRKQARLPQQLLLPRIH